MHTGHSLLTSHPMRLRGNIRQYWTRVAMKTCTHLQHPAQGDLQGAQVFVSGQQVGDAGEAEDVGDGEHTLSKVHGVPLHPVHTI